MVAELLQKDEWSRSKHWIYDFRFWKKIPFRGFRGKRNELAAN